ncbi:MAG: peptide-methionine (S)-S-oxide reductase MsrA [Thermoplasmata archaeon]
MSQATSNEGTGTEVVTLGGGCFWCVEAVLSELRGVQKAVSGYSGGTVENPSYEQVCGGRTGHAEAVEVSFDPAVISLHDLLTVFFTTHDPTTRNRQGGDVGPQYRSVVFYRNAAQKAMAERVAGEIQTAQLWRGPIVTEIVPFAQFYPAEEYHQEYFRRNPEMAYCQLVIEPKVVKFRQHFSAQLRG